MSEPIIHKETKAAICPYCGEAVRDSWDLYGQPDKDYETKCANCEETFIYFRHIYVRVTFSTRKK